ncbi:hypothetical protein N7474_001821 [Penicillium riverlandense]|uniref:uncharacterized protein n=1 Tax=Penicillium riverlandense TaxID=1903569 RepID=UPI0025474EFE|nr:uncharacterized protein N7474_001821 [Penicillium riverlandense]KAJ5833510.1 hypothetical protein N7474_001821 [Penicillium riverlandense]
MATPNSQSTNSISQPTTSFPFLPPGDDTKTTTDSHSHNDETTTPTTSNNKTTDNIHQTLTALLTHLPTQATALLSTTLSLWERYPRLSTFLLSQTLCATFPLLLFVVGATVTTLTAAMIALIVFVDLSQLILIPSLLLSSVFATVLWAWGWAVFFGGRWVLRLCSGEENEGQDGGRVEWWGGRGDDEEGRDKEKEKEKGRDYVKEFKEKVEREEKDRKMQREKEKEKGGSVDLAAGTLKSELEGVPEKDVGKPSEK